jgi:hypothetical protein
MIIMGIVQVKKTLVLYMKKYLFIFFVVLGLLLLSIPGQMRLSKLWFNDLQANVSEWFSAPSSSTLFVSIEEAQAYAVSVRSPVSAKYKGPGQGWIMPFEMYETKQCRSASETSECPKIPVFADINGDGLVDVLYSAYDEPRRDLNRTSRGARARYTGSLTQYILLNRGGRFEVTFQCRQELKVTGNDEHYYGFERYTTLGNNYDPDHYLYYGDCADPSFPYNSTTHTPFNRGQNTNYYAKPFSPGAYFADHPVSRPWPQGFSVDFVSETRFRGKYTCWNPGLFSSEMADSYCDREIPKLLDINGDGLLDVVFKGKSRHLNIRIDQGWGDRFVQNNRNGTPLQFVLYNTGRGFVPHL